jgi:hypothetical protein
MTLEKTVQTLRNIITISAVGAIAVLAYVQVL